MTPGAAGQHAPAAPPRELVESLRRARLLARLVPWATHRVVAGAERPAGSPGPAPVPPPAAPRSMAAPGGARSRAGQRGVPAHGPREAMIAKGMCARPRSKPRSSARRCSSPVSSASEQTGARAGRGPGARPPRPGSPARRTVRSPRRLDTWSTNSKSRSALSRSAGRSSSCAPRPAARSTRSARRAGSSPAPCPAACRRRPRPRAARGSARGRRGGRRSSASQRSTRSMFHRTQDRSSFAGGLEALVLGAGPEAVEHPLGELRRRRSGGRIVLIASRAWLASLWDAHRHGG